MNYQETLHEAQIYADFCATISYTLDELMYENELQNWQQYDEPE